MAGGAIVDPGASCEADPEPFGRKPAECLHCKAVLTGRQRRFCRSTHRTAFWHSLRQNAGQAPAKRTDRKPLRVHIRGLLSDGRWYTVLEIAARLGINPTTADRKMRDLRRPEHGSFRVVYRRRGGQRVNEFRLELA